ncbi:MAG: hypothetical protein LBK70_03755 [Clostridiales bacterium]|jgi:cell fate regulator YaaT (PSP1 superfamily)|nr:hypothetical protein [Clostridiales bacterium]
MLYNINTSDTHSGEDVATIHVNLGARGIIKIASCSTLGLKSGMQVVVRTPKGMFLGVVDSIQNSSNDVSISETGGALQAPTFDNTVERIATQIDIETYQSNAEQAKQSIAICQKISDNLGLDISVVDAEYSLDKHRLSFYFVAKSRVDFRGFAKDLARQFKVYIDLRQVAIQPKDNSQLAICGPCGRDCCCSLGLKRHCTIKMAKNQNLPLNPSNITGLCGNLRCCLSFENEQYSDINCKCPKVGANCCNTEGRCGRVSQINYIKETVLVRHVTDDNVEVVEYSIQDITKE